MVIYNLPEAICIPCGSSPLNCDCWREANDREWALFMEGHISPPSEEVIESGDGRLFFKVTEKEVTPRYSYSL